MKFLACECEAYLARWACHSCGLRVESLHEVKAHTDETGKEHKGFSIYPGEENT